MRSVSSVAWRTRARFSVTPRIVSAAEAVSTRSLRGSLTQQLLGYIYDRRGDLVFWSLRHPSLGSSGDKDDFVLCRVEPDVVAGDVVVDDQIDAFALQFLARARETSFTPVGGKTNQYLAVGPTLGERM